MKEDTTIKMVTLTMWAIDILFGNIIRRFAY